MDAENRIAKLHAEENGVSGRLSTDSFIPHPLDDDVVAPREVAEEYAVLASDASWSLELSHPSEEILQHICDQNPERAIALSRTLSGGTPPIMFNSTEEPVDPFTDDSDDGDYLSYPRPTWQVPPRYTLGKELGCGNYGMVVKAWDSVAGCHVAVKKMQNVFKNTVEAKRILREIAILSRLRHNNIVRIHDLPKPPNLSSFKQLYIVMEYCDTDLQKLFQRRPCVSLQQARQLAYGVCVGVAYLHSAGVYHRDLKPANCLVNNKDCCVKVCDFNLSRLVCIEENSGDAALPPLPLNRKFTTHVVSRWYRAPEVIVQLPYLESMDVWSVGCVLAEIFSAVKKRGHRPIFPGGPCYPIEVSDSMPNDSDQLSFIFNVIGTPSEAELAMLPDKKIRDRLRGYRTRPRQRLRNKVPDEIDETGVSLLEQMLQFIPDNRITMAAALRHPFFDQVRRSPEEGISASNTFHFAELISPKNQAEVRERLKKKIEEYNPGV